MFSWEVWIRLFVDSSNRAESRKKLDKDCRTNARTLGRRVRQLRAAILPHPDLGRRQHQVQRPRLRLLLRRVKPEMNKTSELQAEMKRTIVSNVTVFLIIDQ